VKKKREREGESQNEGCGRDGPKSRRKKTVLSKKEEKLTAGEMGRKKAHRNTANVFAPFGMTKGGGFGGKKGPRSSKKKEGCSNSYLNKELNLRWILLLRKKGNVLLPTKRRF